MTTATFYLFKLYHEAHNFTMKKHYPILYAIRLNIVHNFSYNLAIAFIFRYNHIETQGIITEEKRD